MKVSYILTIVRHWRSWRFWAWNVVLVALAVAMKQIVFPMPHGPLPTFLFLALMTVYFIIFAFVWLEAQWWQVVTILIIIFLYLVGMYYTGEWTPFDSEPEDGIIQQDTQR